jgi:O-antigen/teichoic acid export membrane protein
VTRAPETQSALRNAGFLVIQRGGLLAAGVLFAVMVPRLMGPAAYGRFALVYSLSTLFVMCSTLGFTEVASRFLPELSRRADSRELHRVVGGLLSIRLIAGAVVAAAFLGLTTVWLPDLDGWALAAVTGAIFVRAVSHLLFTFFLGLNHAARWGAGELVSRSLLVVFVLPGYALGGFRGACVGLLLTEVATLAIALEWARSLLRLGRPRLAGRYLGPYLRVGLVYFAVNLLLIAFQASGESLIRLVTHDYAEVSYFGIANSIHLSAVAAIQQLSLAFAALLITLRAQKAEPALREGLRRLVAWIAAAAVAAVYGVLLLGSDLIPLVVGRSFQPVVRTLIPMTLALLPLALASVGSVVAVTHDRSRVLLLGAALRLAVFWGAGPLLVLRVGSLGACEAVLLAYSVQAAYLSWMLRAQMWPVIRSWAACALAGALFLPLVWLRAPVSVEVALFVGALAGFFGVLFLTRVLAVGQVVETWRALGQAGRTRRPEPLQDLGSAAGPSRR